MQKPSQPFADTGKEDRVIQLVVFHILDQEFGVAIEDIREIIKMGLITPIPDSPKFIKGIINVRGDIVTAIDMKSLFSIRDSNRNISRHIVITKQHDNLFGLMVDEVTEVLRIKESEIKPKPSVGVNINQDYLSGVLVFENRLILLLNLSLVLSTVELNQWPSENRLQKDVTIPHGEGL